MSSGWKMVCGLAVVVVALVAVIAYRDIQDRSRAEVLANEQTKRECKKYRDLLGRYERGEPVEKYSSTENVVKAMVKVCDIRQY